MEAQQLAAKTYHINQYVQGSPIPFLDQLGGVVVSPLGLVAQIPGKGFLAPGAFAGVGDGGEGGHGFVFAWVLEELCNAQRHSILPAAGMASRCRNRWETH